MIDLFEYYEDLPIDVQEVINRFNTEDNTYEACEKLAFELNKVGYTCEYGLDASPYGLRKLDVQGQKELFNEIILKTGINIVTCGNCGSVVFHRIPTEEIECSSCGFKSEPCDFPDLYY